jgi:hypothetical protein
MNHRKISHDRSQLQTTSEELTLPLTQMVRVRGVDPMSGCEGICTRAPVRLSWVKYKKRVGSISFIVVCYARNHQRCSHVRSKSE